VIEKEKERGNWIAKVECKDLRLVCQRVGGCELWALREVVGASLPSGSRRGRGIGCSSILYTGGGNSCEEKSERENAAKTNNPPTTPTKKGNWEKTYLPRKEDTREKKKKKIEKRLRKQRVIRILRRGIEG